MTLGLIWAQTRDGVIGADGGMPWHVPEDLARFKAITMGHPVLMGRRTWESIPSRFRPLTGRRNIVITSDPRRVDASAEAAPTPEAALALVAGIDAWVIGGGTVYAALMDRADVLEVTELHLSGGDLSGGDLSGGDLSGGDLSGRDLSGRDLSGRDLSGRDLSVPGDTFAPRIDPSLWTLHHSTDWTTSTEGPRFRFLRYERLTY